MVQAEWPVFPSFRSAMPTTVSTPLLGGAGAGTYSPLAQDVARDVQQFIAQGSSVATALSSPQAQWLARQAARQLQSLDKAPASAPSQRAASTAGSEHALQPQQQAFLSRIAPWAQQAAQQLGVSVRSVLAHAALESGWGQRPVRSADGVDSLNLFGLKAGHHWVGAKTTALTTEFQGGQPVQQLQDFRQYTGLDETFGDYVRLLERSPRYRAALHTGDDVAAFAQALAQGGYATDPDYAQKLLAVSRSIAAAP